MAFDFLPGKSRLPELMLERNLNPQDVYDHPDIQMTKQQFSAYYTSRRKMSASILKLFGNFFGVPMDDICNWDTVPSKRGSAKNRAKKK